MPRLIVVVSDLSLDFRFERAISIGRHVSNTLPLPGGEVSRRHAQIYPTPHGGLFAIADLGSRNGVIVNGRKQERHDLRPGDEIILGSAVLIFDPPEGVPYTERLSPLGAKLWNARPRRLDFQRASVANVSPIELDALLQRWFDRSDPAPLLPYALQSHFLKFAMSLDSYSHRRDLCRAALDFLDERLGGVGRMAIGAPDVEKKQLDILALSGQARAAGRLDFDPDILRVALHAERAIFSYDYAEDFRFRGGSGRPAFGGASDYVVGSFLAAPIFCQGVYYGFLYADQPAGAAGLQFRSLAQAYLTGSLLGNCFHWLGISRQRLVAKEVRQQTENSTTRLPSGFGEKIARNRPDTVVDF